MASLSCPPSIDRVAVRESPDGVLRIIYTNAKRKNAMALEMYLTIGAALNYASANPKIKFVVLSAEGSWFSSGADLSAFLQQKSEAEHLAAADPAGQVTIDFVDSFINCTKPIIAAIQGPCLGISFTTVSLCDIIYCSDAAVFMAPFARAKQSPEGCSSYTFPRIFGPSLGSEVLYLGRGITPKEALETGFVSEVVPAEQFEEFVEEKVKKYTKFDSRTLQKFKVLCRSQEIEKLREVNRAEIKLLVSIWKEPGYFQMVQKAFSRAKL